MRKRLVYQRAGKASYAEPPFHWRTHMTTLPSLGHKEVRTLLSEVLVQPDYETPTKVSEDWDESRLYIL